MLQHEMTEVRTLLAFLDTIGVEYVIAGGYARDLYFGRTPRDLDICCYGLSTTTVLGLDKIQKIVSYTHLHSIFKSKFSTDDDDYPSDRIYGGIKTTVDVDLILWRDEYKTADEVLAKFDFNINQFVLDVSPAYMTYTARPWDGMSEFGQLVKLRDTEVTFERLIKIDKIATYVGWNPRRSFDFNF